MWRLIRLIFTGDAHRHVWAQHEEMVLYGLGGKKLPTGKTIVDRCTVCGKLKRTDIRF